MTARSREAIFVGYESGRKAYRLVDLKTRKIFISKDVRFDEIVHGYGPDHEEQPEYGHAQHDNDSEGIDSSERAITNDER